MTVFNVLGKRQKTLFFAFRIFTKVIIANQRSAFKVKFSPFLNLKMTILFLFVSWARATAFVLVHAGLAPILISRLHLASWQTFLGLCHAFLPHERLLKQATTFVRRYGRIKKKVKGKKRCCASWRHI